jgi:tRNA(Ile)-lysidine synthase
MLHPFESTLAEAWPPSQWADVTILLAISGGADSVALLRAMAALKTGGAGRLAVAHFNHQLRPEADDDQQFVVDLCDRLGVTCEVERTAVNDLATQSGGGLEATARWARYRFLEAVAGRLGARFVVTAHTADDQAETILHRILRGTGVRGLAGMARARPLGHATLIRPLLGIRREELRAYLDELGQPHRSDRSNLDVRFTRNRIRRELLPRLQRRFNPDVVEALLRLGNLAGDAQAVVNGLVAELFDRCVTIDGPNAARIALNGLARVGEGAAPAEPSRRPTVAARFSARQEPRPPGRQECLPHQQECLPHQQECLPHQQECLPSYLVRELLMAIWRRMGWPLQSMGSVKWEELADMAAPTVPAAKRVFPDKVTVEVADGEMRLSKISPLPPGEG